MDGRISQTKLFLQEKNELSDQQKVMRNKELNLRTNIY